MSRERRPSGVGPAEHRRMQLLRIAEEQGGLCCYCGIEMTLTDNNKRNCPRLMTRDHVIPKSRRGRDGIENWVAACRKCNGLKGNQTLQEFQPDRLIWRPQHLTESGPNVP